MKVLFINESTKIKGGVDAIIKTEMDGLKENGFEVDLFKFSHCEFLNGSIYKKLGNVNLYFSEERKIKHFIKKLDLFKPDIVHFHNTYPFYRKPLWSNNILKKIKVVQHLHNYYPFCLNSFFFRDGEICTDCYLEDSFLPGIKNSCYDYSKLKTLLAAYNRPSPSEWIKYSENVDLFLGVSQFVVDKYIELDVDKRKIKKLYNGISFKKREKSKTIGDYILFLGNVVNSKGIEIVCKLAERNSNIKFKIAGLGRDLRVLNEKYKHLANLSFEGYVEEERKYNLIDNCKFLLFPVKSWETFGLIILEAISYGKFVVTSGLGGTSELIENGVTGYKVEDNHIQGYEKVIRKLWGNFVPSPISIEEQKKVMLKFSDDTHINNLINYYNLIL